MTSINPVRFVITGGTIDSKYNPALDTITPRQESIIPEYLQGSLPGREIEFVTVCLKDSRQIDHNDRAAMLTAVNDSPTNHVLITHGVYTLADTAQFIEAGANDDKTVVITGSMMPIDGFTMSDAGFNLGFALAQLDVLSSGVHVCFRGQVWSPDEAVALLNESRNGSIFGE